MEEALNVLNYINLSLEMYKNFGNMLLTLYCQKEITKYGKIVHRPRGKLHFLCLKGEKYIHLSSL